MLAGTELFHSPEGTAFASIKRNGHVETWPVRSSGFRGHLNYAFYSAERRALSTNAMEEALRVLESKARFEGTEQIVYIRIGEQGGKIYLDLGNERWEAIEINPRKNSWKVIKTCPLKFRRPDGMLPLPRSVKARDGRQLLRSLRNVKTDDQLDLIIGRLLGSLRPHGPFPPLVFNSEQGTGKTTAERICTGLIDPSEPRDLPNDSRDLWIAAQNHWILPFQNCSRLPPLALARSDPPILTKIDPGSLWANIEEPRYRWMWASERLTEKTVLHRYSAAGL